MSPTTTEPVPPSQVYFGLVLAALVSACGPAERTIPGAFRDGPRSVVAERTGAPALDTAGRMLTPVRLRYDDRAIEVPARIDRTAIARLDGAMDPEDLGALGVRPIRPLMRSIDLWLVEDAQGGDGLDAAERLGSDSGRSLGVIDAIPNVYLRLRALGEPYTPNDPRLPGQWYFESLHMTEAWGLTLGDASQSIAVVDTGCDLVHPDLAGKIDPGRDVADGDDDPSYEPTDEGAEHGTACAGLAAAMTDNAEGIAGGCPACRLRCVRLLSDDLKPISVNVDAFEFALEADVSVVSNSWGFVDPLPLPQVLADAIENVFVNGRGGRGALVIFAVGNDNRELGDDELPAATGVLGVGAINNLDDQTPFTNSGNAVDLVAPTGTLSTDISGPGGADPGDYMTLFGGTSSACPVVAGIAGLLVSAAPERTSAELYEVLIRTSRPAPYAVPDANGHDPVFGFGIVDPVAALHDVLGDGGGSGGAGGGSGGSGVGGEHPTSHESPPGDEDSGCTCSAGARASPPPVTLFLCAVALLLARRRRV